MLVVVMAVCGAGGGAVGARAAAAARPPRAGPAEGDCPAGPGLAEQDPGALGCAVLWGRAGLGGARFAVQGHCDLRLALGKLLV